MKAAAYTTIYFMQHKTEAIFRLASFCQWIESLGDDYYSLRNLTLKGDQDSMFCSEAWTDFCAERHIKLDFSSTYTLTEWIAERKNQDINRIARSLLLGSGLSRYHLPYAYQHAVLLSNVSPH